MPELTAPIEPLTSTINIIINLNLFVMSIKHLFPGKTVNMAIACKVVSTHFSDNIESLSKARTNWDTAYAASLATRVDAVSATFLGVKTRDELFSATSTLSALIEPAREQLATIKTQLDVDFKNEAAKRNMILSKLGFSGKTPISTSTQSELIALLLTFKRNLTPELITEITTKGMPAALLQGVVDLAEPLDKANTTQEKLKGTVKEASDNVVNELNALYTEIIGICKIASNHFKKEPVKKEMFTFTKILRNIGETRTATEKDTAANPS
jgi:hypothetical protein